MTEKKQFFRRLIAFTLLFLIHINSESLAVSFLLQEIKPPQSNNDSPLPKEFDFLHLLETEEEKRQSHRSSNSLKLNSIFRGQHFTFRTSELAALRKKMADTLQLISQDLETHPEKKLVLVFDLDGSLASQTESLSSELGTDTDSAWKLQQSWFIELACFTNRHPDQVRLVYNTSRSIPLEKRLFGIRSQFPIDLSDQLNSFDTDYPMLYFREKPSMQEYAIPVPDVLISSHGLQIEFPSMPDWNHDTLRQVNQKLFNYYLEDLSLLESACRQSSQILHGMKVFWNSGHNYCYLTGIHDQQILLNPVYLAQPYSRHVFTAVRREKFVTEAFVQNTTLNKGSMLRLAVQLMIQMGLIEYDHFSVAIVGDTHLDLPMLRPDLEAYAAGIISSSEAEFVESRLKALTGMDIPGDLVSQHWLVSINTNPLNLPEDSNPFTREVLDHSKFITLNHFGLLFVMEEIAQRFCTKES